MNRLVRNEFYGKKIISRNKLLKPNSQFTWKKIYKKNIMDKITGNMELEYGYRG